MPKEKAQGRAVVSTNFATQDGRTTTKTTVRPTVTDVHHTAADLRDNVPRDELKGPMPTTFSASPLAAFSSTAGHPEVTAEETRVATEARITAVDHQIADRHDLLSAAAPDDDDNEMQPAPASRKQLRAAEQKRRLQANADARADRMQDDAPPAPRCECTDEILEKFNVDEEKCTSTCPKTGLQLCVLCRDFKMIGDRDGMSWAEFKAACYKQLLADRRDNANAARLRLQRNETSAGPLPAADSETSSLSDQTAEEEEETFGDALDADYY